MNPRKRDLRRHLTAPNLLSTLAVFLVLTGGTAIAAGLKKNSVSSRVVKDNSLTSADLADGKGVAGVDVADGSLRGDDVADRSLGRGSFAPNSIAASDLAEGSLRAADIAAGEIGRAQLGSGSVNSATIRDGGVGDADFGARAITGRSIDESTFTKVRDALRFSGRAPSTFVSSSIYEATSLLEVGIALGDGTFRLSQGCLPGDALLSGGPADVGPNSTLVESFPKDGTWTVRINPHGTVDEFRVAIACANQAGL
jgi:hypothetical protein